MFSQKNSQMQAEITTYIMHVYNIIEAVYYIIDNSFLQLVCFFSHKTFLLAIHNNYYHNQGNAALGLGFTTA